MSLRFIHNNTVQLEQRCASPETKEQVKICAVEQEEQKWEGQEKVKGHCVWV